MYRHNTKRQCKTIIKCSFVRYLIIFCLCLSYSNNVCAQINIDRMIKIGRNALYYNDYVLSIQYFNSIIESRPTLFYPYFYRALAKFYLEDYVGATKDCTSAIDLNPYYHEAYKVRALSYINQNYYDPKDWQNFACCYINLDSLELADSTLITYLKDGQTLLIFM